MKWTPKFNPGDRVVVTRTYSDVRLGQTGFTKRVSEGCPRKDGKCDYVVCLDDGPGWDDHKEGGIGWNIADFLLELDKDHQLFEMDA